MTDEKKPIDLQDLYPTPRTHEQRQEIDRQREDRRLARRPRYMPLRVALGGGLLFFAVLYLFSWLEMLWSSGSMGVSMSFFAATVLLGLGLWLVLYVMSACEQYNVNPGPFLVIWMAVSLAAGGLALRGTILAIWAAVAQGVVSGIILGVVIGSARKRDIR